MCGICGIVSFDSGKMASIEQVRRMTRTLYHRGPDDEGYYQDDEAALGMRRLSIIDLQTGQQPISNETGDIWVIYNGEIYNFRKLRAELERRGHQFKTQSDTETIVHAYEEYGEGCLQHFNGMFALAIWDSRRHRLFLARDRLGIKPLYYWASGGKIVFGSELKAIIVNPDIPCSVDLGALDLYLTLEYIPGPRTIYEGVRKLPPGHTLTYDRDGLRLNQYWDVPVNPITESESSCAEALAELIEEAVHLQLVSDVPIGAFSSGGIDSSTVVAYMSRMSPGSIQTFSIGFKNDSYNELPDAQLVAENFGTNFHFEVLDPDITDLVESLSRGLDEPIADTSIFPTYLVSKLARDSVKVVLSGDGGDELFAGYDTYLAEQLSQYYNWLPVPVRQSALPALANRIAPQPAKKGSINKFKRLVEGAAINPSLRHARWMVYMNPDDKKELYQPGMQAMLREGLTEQLFSECFERGNRFDSLAQGQYVDLKTYLVDDILTKVDRMSMAVSLEVRVPLLDHRIVEFALNLPPHMKLDRSQTKVILRRAVKDLLPRRVLEKQKQGFSIPMKHWLRDSLRPMMQDLLSEESLRQAGYFNPRVVSSWIQEHLNGRSNHSHRLWSLMMFELWRRTRGEV